MTNETTDTERAPEGAHAYWVTFTNRASGCVEALDIDAARALAGTFGTMRRLDRLPYPALPRLGPQSRCPSFCLGKSECHGKTSCPQRRACTE